MLNCEEVLLFDRVLKSFLRWGPLLALLLSVHNRALAGQTDAGKNLKANPVITCAIRTEHREWNPAQPATVYITIESLSDNPSEIPLWSLLYLSPSSPVTYSKPIGVNTGRIAAGVDASALSPFGRPSGAGVRDRKGDDSARLRFSHKGEKVEFVIDARNLTWDFETANRTPTFRLFEITKPGAYDLQFHMYWESGACESPKVRVSIAPVKSLK